MKRKLCVDLGMPHRLMASSLPSEEELNELDKHLQKLRREKESRWSRYQTVRAEILQLVERLKVLPETVLEQVVVCKEPDQLHLTQSNLTSADDYLQRFRALESLRMREHSQLVERLSLYWSLLDVPQQERDFFLRQHSQNTQNTFCKMQEELSQCEALKAERLTEFSTRLKRELQNWYE